MLLGLILSALLLTAPLPGLPALPDGAEIRIVSANLRTVYLSWRVERGFLRLKAKPLAIPEGRRIRLIIRAGRALHAYEGRYLNGDVLIDVPGGYISVRQTFSKIYHLRWPAHSRIFGGAGPPAGNGSAR